MPEMRPGAGAGHGPEFFVTSGTLSLHPYEVHDLLSLGLTPSLSKEGPTVPALPCGSQLCYGSYMKKNRSVVGVRELKNRIGQYLGRVKAGERLTVTDRGRPVAVLSPLPDTHADAGLETILREGLARWGGGKPVGARRPAHVKGPTVAKAVIEGRR